MATALALPGTFTEEAVQISTGMLMSAVQVAEMVFSPSFPIALHVESELVLILW